jgi:rhodanese-related sulfurtransferase
MNQAQIPSVDVLEAERRRTDPDRPAILLDVREPNEFAEARVPGAVLVPMSRFQVEAERLPADRQLLVFCRTGSRSAAVTNYLVQRGVDAVNVAGGIVAWSAAGLEVVGGTPEPGEGDLPPA